MLDKQNIRLSQMSRHEQYVGKTDFKPLHVKNFLSLKIVFILFWMVGICGCKGKDNVEEIVVPTSMRYLENDRIKLGINLDIGGAITWVSDRSNGGKNMINSADWGRQIQLSYYSGPIPYIGPNGEQPVASWAGLGWSPIQSGDAGGNGSKVTLFERQGENAMFVRCIPMQWPHTTGVSGDCEFEVLYTLEGAVFTVEATIRNHRPDKTQYAGRQQEMPALYTNGSWYRLVTYLGDQPFQNRPTTVIVTDNDGKGWPWVHFYSPEHWVALLDASGKGIGVFQPEVTEFNGGFAGGDGNKGSGGEKDGPTGHIAPIASHILDHNISWTYKTSFILGTIDDIRNYAKNHLTQPACPEWIFRDSRLGWYYSDNNIHDSGWPVRESLDITFAGATSLISPVTFWKADDAPVLEIEGAFTTGSGQLTLGIHIQPVGRSDFTDWLNWSEGAQTVEGEKQAKQAEFPATPPITVHKTIAADGVHRTYRFNLSEETAYTGGIKSMTIAFPESGTAKIKKIALNSE